MPSAHDVAAAILKRTGPLDTFKLQKLVYYSKAWHLVWDGEPLFDERIEAWANGPVIPALYNEHRGRYQVDVWPIGDEGNLTPEQLESIEAVLRTYRKYAGWQLAELTHREDPWRQAREKAGLRPGQRGNVEIPDEAIQIYYEGLLGTGR